jgi:hypothetical protein
MKGFIVIFLAAIVFISCTTIKEPVENGSLLIGEVHQFGTGYPNNDGARLNGKHSTGIILTFKNIDTNEKVNAKSNYGIYFVENIPAGKYQLINLHLKVEDSSGSNSAGMSCSSKAFSIEENQVCNLGDIELFFNYSNGLSYKQNNKYDYAIDYLTKAKSKWLTKNQINKEIN